MTTLKFLKISRESILDHGSEMEKEMLNTQRICRKFLEVVSKNDTHSFLTSLSDIVWADGKILPIEKKVFLNIAQNLKLPNELIQKHIKAIEAIEESLNANPEEEQKTHTRGDAGNQRQEAKTNRGCHLAPEYRAQLSLL